MDFDFLGVLADLFDGADATDSAADTVAQSGGHAAPVHFEGGRWEGTDQWGNPVEQSSLGPPTNANTGVPVDPNDVTWKK